MSNPFRSTLARCRRPVIKIGSAVLAGGKAGPPSRPSWLRSSVAKPPPPFDREKFSALCDDLAQVAQGRTPVVVSSGAVALGVERLGLSAPPRGGAPKHAAAPRGPTRLMGPYADAPEARG